MIDGALVAWFDLTALSVAFESLALFAGQERFHLFDLTQL